MKRLVLVALVLTCLTFGNGPVRADYAAITFSQSTNDTNNSIAMKVPGWSLGYEFSVSSNLKVNALGFYDAHGAPLHDTHDVGIYDTTGTLLAQTTVTNSDLVSDNFRYHPISGLTLHAGQSYYLAAATGTVDNYTWGTTNTQTGPGITYLTDVFVASATLTFPTSSDGMTTLSKAGWFGPNFRVSSSPEPGSLLLLSLGTLGVGGWCCRRRRWQANAA
jgi:hypothetical protein